MLVALAALAVLYFRFSAAQMVPVLEALETSLVIVETHDSETCCCSGQSSNAKNNQHYGKSLFEGHNLTQRIMPKLPDWNLTWNHMESQTSPSERIDLWYSPYTSKKQRPFQCPNMSKQLRSQLQASRRKPRNSRLWPAGMEANRSRCQNLKQSASRTLKVQVYRSVSKIGKQLNDHLVNFLGRDRYRMVCHGMPLKVPFSC